MKTSIKTLWTQYEAWLSERWPDVLADLNPPATDQELSSLEDALGVPLPQDYKDCLRVHNGQRYTRGAVLAEGEFLSTEAIAQQWAVWKDLLDSSDFEGLESEPQAGIKNDWWNARWIPFTHDGGGNHLCLDMDPAADGAVGQVIAMWHDMEERTVEGTGFGAWFEQYVRDALDGQYQYDADGQGIVPTNP